MKRVNSQRFSFVLFVFGLLFSICPTVPSAYASGTYTTGSVQLGGSGQYLSAPNAGDFAVGTGDFTVEWWQYMTAMPGATSVGEWPRVWWSDSNTYFGVSIESYNTNAPMFYLWLNGANAVGVLSSFDTTHLNKWKHFAVTRSGTSLRVFVDGSQLGSTITNSTNISDSISALAIGNMKSNAARCAFPGRITNFHFVKGTALYTSAFTVPSSPVTAVANSKLLLLFPNDAGGWLRDSSPLNKTLTDSGSPSYSYTSPSWTNPDSTAPTITGPSSATGANSSISIAESTTAVHTFTANESVTWSKSGTDGSFFSITSAGGVLTMTARDFESPVDNGTNNTYVVTITATDTAGNATNQTLTVTITNVNEAPTITTASSAATHSIAQAENISSVVTYTGSDVDAGTTFTWSISGTDAADFSINSSSGSLAFAANPDFEAAADSDTNNSYILIVTLSDGSLTDTQTVTITITNANESASINEPTVSGTINKGVNTTITVTINVAGKVRFFVGNKRISTCKERTTSGTYPNNTATCTWKPAVTGRQILTATLTPTDNTFSASTSARTEVFVVKRGTTR
jgi:VCBS repeat-containing protein